MSRKTRKIRKQERRAEKVRHKQQPMHVQMNGYTSVDDYIRWWNNEHKAKPMANQNKNKVRAIMAEDSIPIPWDWEMTRTIAGERKKKQVIKSADKKVKREMYVQGDQLFLCENGLTQKITGQHRLKIIDFKKVVFDDRAPEDIIKWTYEEEMRRRTQAVEIKENQKK